MFGLDTRLEAVIEIVVLLLLAAFVGWVVGRLVLAARLSALRAKVADKEAELEKERWSKVPGLSTSRTPPTSPTPEEPVGEETSLEEPPAFIPADPLLPVLTLDDTPEMMPVETAPPPVSLPANGSVHTESRPLVEATAMVGNSEAAVLSRIAARANEVNFDRIGRAAATEADDLKDIVGIGPFLERKLHSLGIYTFRQVANFTKEDVDKVNELIEFFPGRIERDNWVEQSKEFHKRKSRQKA